MQAKSINRNGLLLLGEEDLPEDPHGVFRAVDGVTYRPRVVVDLVVVAALVGLVAGKTVSYDAGQPIAQDSPCHRRSGSP
jgi:hypothetical protein